MRYERELAMIRRGLLVAPVVLVLFLLGMASPATAQSINCASPTNDDTDGDGLTDIEECTGLTQAVGATAAINIASCITPPIVTIESTETPTTTAVVDRATCLDPNTKDLFVILVPAVQGSLLPADPLALISKAVSQGGLDVTVHRIEAAQAGPNREVTNRVAIEGPATQQKAIRITENLDPTGDIMGISNYGTPNGLDGAVVYTQRIKNLVQSVYAQANQTAPAEVIATHIRHTIAHEAGHTAALTKDYNARFGGNHYKTGTVVVMEQSVTYSVKGGNVSFNISVNFAPPDPTDATYK